MTLFFEKFQANGNDYVLIDSIDKNDTITYRKKIELTMEWCKRSYSIGADDAIFIEKSTCADAKITIIEPDGSEADMCGNGIRCVAAYLCKKLNVKELIIETLAGLKTIILENENYRVNMGEVIMESNFFIEKNYIGFMPEKGLDNVRLDYPKIGEYTGSIIYTGEPNIVFILDDIDSIDIESWGQNISLNKKFFPQGICTVLVEKKSNNSIYARFFEKGVYKETNACGTGSTAAAYIAKKKLNIEEARIDVITKGGLIYVEPEINNPNTFMIGEAKRVYQGSIEI